MDSFFVFFAFTLFCIALEGFFSMFEMASVSLNKVRLLYYASKGSKKALWLQFLLHHPTHLFGTTLIMVTVALQLGSEASRHLYESLGLLPDLAPLTQILVVLVFGELIPLFAARKHPETVAFFAVPIVYATSKLLAPFLWGIDRIYKSIYHLFRRKEGPLTLFLSKEEIQRVFEKSFAREGGELQKTASIESHLFSLHEKRIGSLILPLSSQLLISSSATVKALFVLLEKVYVPFFLLYRDRKESISSILYSKDLVEAKASDKAQDYAQTPLFLAESSSLLSLLQRMQSSAHEAILTVDSLGKVSGLITKDRLVDDLFGKEELSESLFIGNQILIERTFPSETLLEDFYQKFHLRLEYKGAKTLGELLTLLLGHPPSEGERVSFAHLEFTVLSVSLLGPTFIQVKTELP